MWITLIELAPDLFALIMPTSAAAYLVLVHRVLPDLRK